MTEINKSSRHAKIIGDFGESLVCNWLSRSGFEVTMVDHTGIDVVAFNPRTDERLGISVKSRTRMAGKEGESVYVFRAGDRAKMLDACRAFACEPWIAVYVETEDHADLFVTSLRNYDEKYRPKEKRTYDAWSMNPKVAQKYDDDPNVKHIRIAFSAENWSWSHG